jgi:hypothetical protein
LSPAERKPWVDMFATRVAERKAGKQSKHKAPQTLLPDESSLVPQQRSATNHAIGDSQWPVAASRVTVARQQ